MLSSDTRNFRIAKIFLLVSGNFSSYTKILLFFYHMTQKISGLLLNFRIAMLACYWVFSLSGVWVEKMWLTAPGMDANNIHTACPAEGPCLPIGIHNEDTVSQGMEDEATPARRMVPQILFQFYSKPMKPQRTCLASSANPWQQKRTMLTQECIRRLRNTSRNLCCKKKQDILSEYMQILKNSG